MLRAITLVALIVRVALDPVDVVGHPDVDAGVVLQATAIAVAGHSYQHPLPVRHLGHQRPSTVALQKRYQICPRERYKESDGVRDG